MTRWCTALVLTVAAAMLAAQGARAEDRALLVGVGVYGQQRPFPNLPGIDRDLGIMRDVALELGFEERQIRVLADEEATLDGMRRAFEDWLIDAVGPGDRALFYFSGHGHQIPDRDGDETDRRDEILLPHDYGGTAEALTNVVVDDDMAAWIDRLRTDDVLIFLDACNSGTAVRSPAGSLGWSMFADDAAKGVSTKGPEVADVGYLALSAARDSELAQATRNGSTFTIGIGRAVREAAASGSPLTMEGIRERAAAEIAEAHPTELFHPVLSGDLSRAGHDLLRRRPRPGRGLWHRLVEATSAAPPSRRVDVRDVQPVYRAGERMSFEVVMPADGYLNVVAVERNSGETEVFFPYVLTPLQFGRGDVVPIPYPGRVTGEIFTRLVDPTRLDEESLLVVIVSEGPLDLRRQAVEAVVPLLDDLYRSGVSYVVSR